VGEIETHMVGWAAISIASGHTRLSRAPGISIGRPSAHTGDLQVREFAREQERAVEIFLDRDVRRSSRNGSSTPSSAAPFWRGASGKWRGHTVPLATIRPPGSGRRDVYTILKYLALVFPQAGNSRRIGG